MLIFVCVCLCVCCKTALLLLQRAMKHLTHPRVALRDHSCVMASRPEIDDPAHANAFATSAWELTLLRSSYHPFLTRLTGLILRQGELPAAVARLSANALVEAYDCSAGGFNPAVQAPPTYPASKRVYKAIDYRTPSALVLDLTRTAKHHPLPSVAATPGGAFTTDAIAAHWVQRAQREAVAQGRYLLAQARQHTDAATEDSRASASATAAP